MVSVSGANSGRPWILEGWLSPTKISLIYMLVAGLWIVLSERSLVAFVHDPGSHARGHIVGGLVFAVATGVMLYFLVDRFVRELRRSEREVQQARDQLAHAGRLGVMGEMAAGIAHEVSQPLTAIANYAQACGRLLEAGEADNPDVAESIGEITKEAMRAGRSSTGSRGSCGGKRASAPCAT
jgi:signal transduction histidine kinase